MSTSTESIQREGLGSPTWQPCHPPCPREERVRLWLVQGEIYAHLSPISHVNIRAKYAFLLLWQGVTWKWYFTCCEERRKKRCFGPRVNNKWQILLPSVIAEGAMLAVSWMWSPDRAWKHPTSSADITPKVEISRCYLALSNLHFGSTSGRMFSPWSLGEAWLGSAWLIPKAVLPSLTELCWEGIVVAGIAAAGHHRTRPGRQEAQFAFYCAYALFLQQQSSQGDYCASGKSNLCLTGVPVVAACSGNAGVCMNAVAPGWKHCKDEPRAWRKVVPNQVVRVPFSWIHAVLISDTVSFVGFFGPVTDLSLTMLLLLPCESRDA